jgi:hypothetical protein
MGVGRPSLSCDLPQQLRAAAAAPETRPHQQLRSPLIADRPDATFTVMPPFRATRLRRSVDGQYYLDALNEVWTSFYNVDILAGITNVTAQGLVIGARARVVCGRGWAAWRCDCASGPREGSRLRRLGPAGFHTSGAR